MNGRVEAYLFGRRADLVRFVDLAGLPPERTRGFSSAILLAITLSPEFILAIHEDRPCDDEYLRKEKQVEDLADALAEELRRCGFPAQSQSERANLQSGYAERAYIDPDLVQGISPLPQKMIARMAGLGFIGKNNLLVTPAFGCALCLCSVLTEAPLETFAGAELPGMCGDCDECVRACPAGALHGNTWSGNRSDLVDVSACCCALKCMMACPWTLRYAKKRQIRSSGDGGGHAIL